MRLFAVAKTWPKKNPPPAMKRKAVFCTHSKHLRDPVGLCLAELERACKYASAENTCILRQCYDAYDCGRADRKAVAFSLVERLEGVDLGRRLDAALEPVIYPAEFLKISCRVSNNSNHILGQFQGHACVPSLSLRGHPSFQTSPSWPRYRRIPLGANVACLPTFSVLEVSIRDAVNVLWRRLPYARTRRSKDVSDSCSTVKTPLGHMN
jgi:hypothetical protein